MRLLFLLYIIFSCTACSSGRALQEQKAGGPLLWRVSDVTSGSVVYVLGTLHYGVPDLYPLPPYILNALDESSKLIVEVDVTRIDGSAALDEVSILGQADSPNAWPMKVGANVRSGLLNICSELRISCERLGGVKPWFAAIQLTSVQLQRSGFDHFLGVDRHILGRVHKRGDISEVVELESLVSQLGTFDQLSEQQQLRFLEQTVARFPTGVDYLEQLVDAWRRGDQDSLESLLVDSFEADPVLGEIYELTVTRRNDLVLDALQKELSDGASAFVAVGVSHLLGGRGVLARLEPQYSVELLGGPP